MVDFLFISKLLITNYQLLTNMTKEIKLQAEIRQEKNGRAKSIRESGFIPAVLYGQKTENKNLKIKKLDLERVYAVAKESNLIDLTVDGGPPVKVLIKDMQRHPVKGNLMHIDFYQVDMTKEIITEISLNFIGEPKAVKEMGGTLVKVMDSVEIECLPDKLVNQIDVDISGLDAFGDSIKLRDLKLPVGIKLTSETNDMVVGVTETKVEEEKKVEEIKEGEEGEKKEGEEGEEGEKKEEAKKDGDSGKEEKKK